MRIFLAVNSAVLFIPIICALPASVQAVDSSRLWLPSSYKQHTSKLKKAANLAEEKAPRCLEVISGSLSQDISILDAPIFRVICRDENRRTHAMQIDGSSFDVVDLSYPSGRVSFEQLVLDKIAADQRELERLAELERLKILQQQRDDWADCQKQLQVKVKNMRSVVWLTTEMPEQEVIVTASKPESAVEEVADTSTQSDGVNETVEEVVPEPPATLFTVDFDAQDIYAKALYYRAQCLYRADKQPVITIRPRRDD